MLQQEEAGHVPHSFADLNDGDCGTGFEENQGKRTIRANAVNSLYSLRRALNVTPMSLEDALKRYVSDEASAKDITKWYKEIRRENLWHGLRPLVMWLVIIIGVLAIYFFAWPALKELLSFELSDLS
jgi:hypothetical protein